MMHKVGERIQKYRKQRNMSQEELAVLLNVSRQTVSKWETGDTVPDVYNAVALAQLFHITLDGLVLGHQKFGGSSYIAELKENRRKINFKAMIVGSIGSVMFATSIIMLRTFDVQNPVAGYIMAPVLIVLCCLWGYAIWNFIKIGRLSEEIKYVEKLELIKLRNGVKED